MGTLEKLYGRRPTEPFGGPAQAVIVTDQLSTDPLHPGPLHPGPLHAGERGDAPRLAGDRDSR